MAYHTGDIGNIKSVQETLAVLEEIKKIASTVPPEKLETALAGNLPRGKDAIGVLAKLGALTIPEMIQVMCDRGYMAEVREKAVEETVLVVSEGWKTMPVLVLYDAVAAVKNLRGDKAKSVKDAAAAAYDELARNKGLLERVKGFRERTGRGDILKQNLQMCGSALLPGKNGGVRKAAIIR